MPSFTYLSGRAIEFVRCGFAMTAGVLWEHAVRCGSGFEEVVSRIRAPASFFEKILVRPNDSRYYIQAALREARRWGVSSVG